jgi:hypothetical protein
MTLQIPCKMQAKNKKVGWLQWWMEASVRCSMTLEHINFSIILLLYFVREMAMGNRFGKNMRLAR